MTCVAVWGEHAARFVALHVIARVIAVFSRSVHLEWDGDLICIGDVSVGRGPLNAVLAAGGWQRLAGDMPAVGAGVRIEGGEIHLGGMAISTATAKPWRPAAWPSAIQGTGVFLALQRLELLAGGQAPVDGLARIVLGSAGERGSALERVARPRIERLRAWLAGCLRAPPHGRPPVDLLGLGPGLTPSGDDLLCGALVGLHALGQDGVARELSAQIASAGPSATSPLSRAFLRAAAEGQACEPLHGMIIALLENRSLARHVEALGRVGHTSGWDALAGAVLVLRASGTLDGHRDGVARAGISK